MSNLHAHHCLITFNLVWSWRQFILMGIFNVKNYCIIYLFIYLFILKLSFHLTANSNSYLSQCTYSFLSICQPKGGCQDCKPYKEYCVNWSKKGMCNNSWYKNYLKKFCCQSCGYDCNHAGWDVRFVWWIKDAFV